MKHLTISILFLNWFIPVYSQTTFLDPRDETTYSVVTIGDLEWFSSNLKYRSGLSFCKSYPEAVQCAENNYYAYSEIDSVCPPSWRIPTWTEWQNAIYDYADNNAIHRDSIRVDSSTLNRHSISINGINLFHDTEGLKLKSTGWIEGKKATKEKKLLKEPFSTFWIKEPATLDETTHVHVSSSKQVKHGHDHHIIDKPNSTRKFTVRCVRNKH